MPFLTSNKTTNEEQLPDREACESFVEPFVQQKKHEVREKWSNLLNTAFESSDAAKKVEPDTLNKVKEEVLVNMLKQVEGAVTYGGGVRMSGRLNDSDVWMEQ